MAINTGNIAKLLMPGLNAVWGSEYTDFPTQYTELFDVSTSEKNYEEDQLLPGFGLAPVKLEGSSIAYDTLSQGLTTRYTHVAYAKGFVITREAIEDNQYKAKALSGTKRLARSLRQTKENVAANVYNRGFATYLGADGKVLFAADHPTTAGSQSNVIGTAADLSESSLEDLIVQIKSAVDDVGLRINLMPQKLIVPVGEMFNAVRILESMGQNDTANNAVNAVRAMKLFSGGATVNNYLTDTDAWFIKTDVDNGMRFFQRISAEFANDNDFDTYNLKYKAYERYAAGWTDWRGSYGSAGA